MSEKREQPAADLMACMRRVRREPSLWDVLMPGAPRPTDREVLLVNLQIANAELRIAFGANTRKAATA